MKKEKVARFQDRLREALTLRGMKAIDLSGKIQMSHSTISRYLSGKTAPMGEHLNLICSTLNVSCSWMLGYDVPMNSSTEQIENDDIYHLSRIVQNGEVKIPSIFMFENSSVLSKFLECARRMNCVVIFENENIEIKHNEEDPRLKMFVYEQIIDNRDIENSYFRYLGNRDKMSWDNV